jgi:uncharacterized protein YukE
MLTGSYDVISEHEHIHHLVDRLEAWIERRQLNAEWVMELGERLDRLNADLSPHFQGEEAAVFQDVSTRIPRLASAVERLVEQHRRMLKDFTRILSCVRSLNVQDDSATEELIEQITKALRLLNVHEQQEMELILTAYGQDLGEPM